MSQIVEKIYRRIDSVDFLRGLVMVIMLIDHTREYVHADAFRLIPTDLTKANVMLFLTPWITHLCAPTSAAGTAKSNKAVEVFHLVIFKLQAAGYSLKCF